MLNALIYKAVWVAKPLARINATLWNLRAQAIHMKSRVIGVSTASTKRTPLWVPAGQLVNGRHQADAGQGSFLMVLGTTNMACMALWTSLSHGRTVLLHGQGIY